MTPEQWQKVDQVFAGAEGLRGSALEEYLDQHCAGDPHLRREVEALLAFDAPADTGLLSGVVKAAAELLTDSPLRKMRAALPTQHIGPYRILEPIGSGGMGDVYLAVREDADYQKRVAIKIVRSAGPETSLLTERFKQERQILARLEHPNICRFLDGGVTVDGLLYYVMEYIEDGRPITKYCEAKDLSIPARLELFRQVCSAVEFAHQSLIVHRDLKPSNILIDKDGVPKLLDFGIAKNLDASVTGQINTKTVLRLLTPDYASPEQVLGTAVTTVADVYALGVILYELLTGVRAQKIPNYTSTEIERVVCRQHPVLPSKAVLLPEASPAKVRLARVLAGDLDAIVSKAMRKEPDLRYRSADHLSEDVRRYLEGQPITARRGTIRYVALKFLRRNKIAVTAAGLVFASLSTGLSFAVVQANRAQNRFDQVRLLARTLLVDFDRQVAELPQSTEMRQWIAATVVKYLDNLARDAGSDRQLRLELANGYRLVGNLQGSPAAANLGQGRQAQESFTKAVQLLRSLAAESPSDPVINRSYCGALSGLAQIEIYFGQDRLAGTRYAEALRLGENLYLQTQTRDCLASALHGLSSLQIRSASPRAAIPHLNRLVELVRQEDASPGALRARIATQLLLSSVLQETADPQASLDSSQKAMRLIADLTQATDWNTAARMDVIHTHHAIGDVYGNPRYIHLHDYERAVHHYHEALEAAESVAKADATDARSRRELGRALRKYGFLLIDTRPVEALAIYERAFALSQRNLETAPDNAEFTRDHADAYLGIAYCYQALKQHGKALGNLREALRLQEKLAKMSPDWKRFQRELQETYQAIGDTMVQSGDLDGALAHYERAMASTVSLIWERPTEPFLQRDLADNHEAMARYYAAAGKFREAAAAQEKSLQIWRNWAQWAKPGIYSQRRVQEGEALLARYRRQ